MQVIHGPSTKPSQRWFFGRVKRTREEGLGVDKSWTKYLSFNAGVGLGGRVQGAGPEVGSRDRSRGRVQGQVQRLGPGTGPEVGSRDRSRGWVQGQVQRLGPGTGPEVGSRDRSRGWVLGIWVQVFGSRYLGPVEVQEVGLVGLVVQDCIQWMSPKGEVQGYARGRVQRV